MWSNFPSYEHRFIVKPNSTYGLYISNTLNNEKISKVRIFENDYFWCIQPVYMFFIYLFIFFFFSFVFVFVFFLLFVLDFFIHHLLFLLNQMFHCMDAGTAFSFTISSQRNLTHSGFRNIAQEAQVCFSCYFIHCSSLVPY